MKRVERMRRMYTQGLSCAQIAEVEEISTSKVAQTLRQPKVNSRAPLLLKASAAAAYLGIHSNTLRRWSNDGRLPCTRLANNRGDRRYRRQDLDTFLAKGGDPWSVQNATNR